MNPIERAITWIDILLDPLLNAGMKPFKQGKHAGGSKPSPVAREQRRTKNKREREARKIMYSRARGR